MNSWDLFDTLIGRTCGSPSEIFKQIAVDIGDPNFPAKRVAAERVLQNQHIEYSLEDIYNSYTKVKTLAKTLADKEWQLELANVFPIKKYSDSVMDGDIIVSDMYLNSKQLQMLMEKAGIYKKVKIYVSCYGKHSGTVWKNIPEIKSIITHTGDNKFSDVDKPMQYGIRTVSASSGMNADELKYSNWSPELAIWLRKERLSTSPNLLRDNRLHYIQLEYNIPFLWASSQALYTYYLRKNLKKLLFMSRDCQIFMKVFQKLYPDVDCEYIYISRDCLQSESETYFKYLNQRLTHDTALVDISASCGSLRTALPFLKVKNPNIWTTFFLKEPFKVDLGPIRMEKIAINTETRCNNTHLEKLNYADHWHIIDVNSKGKPIYIQPDEYDMDIVKKYHKFIYDAIETIPTNKLDNPFGIVNYTLEHINTEGNYLKVVFPNHGKLEIMRKQKVIAKNSKVVIVSACWGYEWKRLSTWYKSIRKSGFTDDVHMIDLGLDDDTVDKMTKAGIIVTTFVPTKRANIVERFNSLATLILKMPPDTWVIFSDADDLVFQKNPIDYLKIVPSYHSIVVATEGVRFRENEWARGNLLHSFPKKYNELSDKFFFNAGSIAGKAKILGEICKETVKLCDSSTTGQKHDQAALNILLYSEKYFSQVHYTKPDDGWCFCGASTIFAKQNDRKTYHGIPPRIIDGVCKTSKGIIPVMFHHYTRNRVAKEQVIKRYGHS